MPKVTCDCGHVFNLSLSPLEEEFALIPEETIYAVLGTELTADEVVDQFNKKARQVLICPECERLLLQIGASDYYATYKRVDRASEKSDEDGRTGAEG